jgi:hypothetical protein
MKGNQKMFAILVNSYKNDFAYLTKNKELVPFSEVNGIFDYNEALMFNTKTEAEQYVAALTVQEQEMQELGLAYSIVKLADKPTA